MKKILVIIIIGLFAYSCASKKVVTEFKEVVKLDSVYIVKDRFITKKVVDTLVVESPCDTVTGLLKDFEKEIRTSNAKVKLSSVKGSIQVTVNIDSIVNSKISEFKQNYKTEVEYKEINITKYKTPFWMWGIVLIEGLLIFLLIRFR